MEKKIGVQKKMDDLPEITHVIGKVIAKFSWVLSMGFFLLPNFLSCFLIITW